MLFTVCMYIYIYTVVSTFIRIIYFQQLKMVLSQLFVYSAVVCQ